MAVQSRALAITQSLGDGVQLGQCREKFRQCGELIGSYKLRHCRTLVLKNSAGVSIYSTVSTIYSLRFMILQGLKNQIREMLFGIEGQKESGEELGIRSQDDVSRQGSMSASVAYSVVDVRDSSREG